MSRNRVIKFRAWDKEENKMINNVVPFFNSDGTLECLVFRYSFGGYDFTEVELDKYQHIFTDSEFDKRYVLMQYTGLKDKNGVEIYEGDIVHLTSDEGVNYNALIIFKDGGFCAINGTESDYSFRRYDLSRFDLYLEVIGDIYENPELLDIEECEEE